jgi:hypothetical protein
MEAEPSIIERLQIRVVPANELPAGYHEITVALASSASAYRDHVEHVADERSLGDSFWFLLDLLAQDRGVNAAAEVPESIHARSGGTSGPGWDGLIRDAVGTFGASGRHATTPDLTLRASSLIPSRNSQDRPGRALVEKLILTWLPTNPMFLHLREIGKYPLLTRAGEHEHSVHIQARDPEALERMVLSDGLPGSSHLPAALSFYLRFWSEPFIGRT